MHTTFTGEATGFVNADWPDDEPRPVYYINRQGAGEVLYLNLGHARGHYDMQPRVPYYPEIERGSWENPEYYELLRRGLKVLRWDIATMPHPFRFAVQSFNADSGQDWAAKVQRAESLGYSAFHLADHLIGPGPALSRTNHPIQGLAAVPAMAYAAAVTSKINIGCRVFCVDYRLPVVLAKEAMTIDLLSGGRLELRLGAGMAKR